MKKTPGEDGNLQRPSKLREIRSAKDLLDILSEDDGRELAGFTELFAGRVASIIAERLPALGTMIRRHLMAAYRSETGIDVKSIRDNRGMHNVAIPSPEEVEFDKTYAKRRTSETFANDYLYVAQAIHLVSTSRTAISDISKGSLDHKSSQQVLDIIDQLISLLEKVSMQEKFRGEGTTEKVLGKFDLYSASASVDLICMLLVVNLKETKNEIMKKMVADQQSKKDKPTEVSGLTVTEIKTILDLLKIIFEVCRSFVQKGQKPTNTLPASVNPYTLETHIATWSIDYLRMLELSLASILKTMEAKPGLFIAQVLNEHGPLPKPAQVTEAPTTVSTGTSSK